VEAELFLPSPVKQYEPDEERERQLRCDRGCVCTKGRSGKQQRRGLLRVGALEGGSCSSEFGRRGEIILCAGLCGSRNELGISTVSLMVRKGKERKEHVSKRTTKSSSSATAFARRFSESGIICKLSAATRYCSSRVRQRALLDRKSWEGQEERTNLLPDLVLVFPRRFHRVRPRLCLLTLFLVALHVANQATVQCCR
jgi:hypothetical protein